MRKIIKRFFQENKRCKNCNGVGYIKTKRAGAGWIESQCGHCYGTGRVCR